MRMYHHILLATDLTPASHPVVKKAMELSKGCGAKLTLIHTVEHLPNYAYGYTGAVDIEKELLDAAKESMSKLGEETHVPEADQIVESGPPKARILDAAEELAVDLIIVGSHGRHGVQRLLGSTAASVLHGAKCDVLTVRYKD